MLKPIFALALAAVFTALPIRAQHGGGESPAGLAEQVYKNITELKGTPADQIGPAMQFISTALGVECTFCHVPEKFEADDKPAKKTAREMMAMTAMINKTSFNGRQQVTCYSCHHGLSHPASAPPVLESDTPAHSTAAPAPAGGAAPSVDQILDKYTAAVGGADALHKVTSREMKGVILANGSQSPIELLTKAPNERISISHMGSAASYTAFDGAAGWLGTAGRPARQMSPAESWAAGLDAEFYLPLRLREIFPQLRRGRPETINGVECEVLNGSAPGHPPVRLYFEKTTGLLVRLVRYADTPMGRMPTQIDYADYKDSGGAKVPYRWTLSRPNGRFTIQISEMKVNVPIDDARFRKPDGPVN
jgi:photosynthetic reaction center cytochrome c subunit